MLKNYLKYSIIIFGFLDFLCIVWMVYNEIIDKKIPFYSSLLQDIHTAQSFGSVYPYFFVTITHLLKISLLCSAVMLMYIKWQTWGVWLSIIQFPFRITFIMPPTFFFLANLRSESFSWITLSAFFLIILLECAKFMIQIFWLKNLKKNFH